MATKAALTRTDITSCLIIRRNRFPRSCGNEKASVAAKQKSRLAGSRSRTPVPMGFSFQRATAAMTHVAGHMLLDKENTASDVWADTAYRPGDDDCYTFAQTLAASAAA